MSAPAMRDLRTIDVENTPRLPGKRAAIERSGSIHSELERPPQVETTGPTGQMVLRHGQVISGVASVLTLTIVSVIPGPAQQEPGILSPSHLWIPGSRQVARPG